MIFLPNRKKNWSTHRDGTKSRKAKRRIKHDCVVNENSHRYCKIQIFLFIYFFSIVPLVSAEECNRKVV